MSRNTTGLKKKSVPSNSTGKLARENSELRERLGEAEETLRAIREGEVDAVIVSGTKGDRVFSLVETENLYRLMVETMNEAGVAVSPDGTLIFCNDRAADLLQHTKEELLGRSLVDFVADSDKERFNRLLQTALSQTANEQFFFRLKNGSSLPMHLWASHLDRADGPLICLIGTDLSKLEAQKEMVTLLQKQHEELLKSRTAALNLMEDALEAKKKVEESELKYRRLFESAKDGILILDFDTGLIVDANQFMLDVLGYSLDDLLKKHLWDLGIFKDIVASKDAYAELQDKKIIRYENLPLESRNGNRMLVEFVSNVYLVDNKQVIQCNIRDITERRKAEEERERLLKALNQRADELTLANKELEAFSYSVSHDLRNPLNAIIINTEVLAMEVGAKLGTDAATAMANITQSGERMARVITDLLTLSGISRRNLERHQTNLSEMVQSAITELKATTPQRETEVKIQEGLVVGADPGLLRLMVENLVRNAWKFTSQRKMTHFELGTMDKDGKRFYFIRDNGVGFDMEDAIKMFEPYRRLHSEQEFKGSGIGLTIVKSIVERHGGTIWAEGEKDKGATFYFNLA
ncbi:MAG: PAS domain S-box protein [Fibrobacterota bacterium]